MLTQLGLWLACSREWMSCVGRLPIFVQLSATNPDSTSHNGSQHRRGCLLPSPIIISLLNCVLNCLRDCERFASLRSQLYHLLHSAVSVLKTRISA